jgi:hypothetical protein
MTLYLLQQIVQSSRTPRRHLDLDRPANDVVPNPFSAFRPDLVVRIRKLSISASVRKFFFAGIDDALGIDSAFTTSYTQTARFRQYVSLQIGQNVTNERRLI